MTELTATPGQTIGPFFGYALPFDRGDELVPLAHRVPSSCTAPSPTGRGARSRCAAGDLAGRCGRGRADVQFPSP